MNTAWRALSGSESQPSITWHVVESHGRWAHACRWLLASERPHDVLVSWTWQSVDDLGKPRCEAAGAAVVIWEVPPGAAALAGLLDRVARLADDAPEVLQVAAPLPAASRQAWQLAALALQQTGVTLLLGDFWTLRSLAHRLGPPG